MQAAESKCVVNRKTNDEIMHQLLLLRILYNLPTPSSKFDNSFYRLIILILIRLQISLWDCFFTCQHLSNLFNQIAKRFMCFPSLVCLHKMKLSSFALFGYVILIFSLCMSMASVWFVFNVKILYKLNFTKMVPLLIWMPRRTPYF